VSDHGSEWVAGLICLLLGAVVGHRGVVADNPAFLVFGAFWIVVGLMLIIVSGIPRRRTR